jgi:hypothetical protein
VTAITRRDAIADEGDSLLPEFISRVLGPKVSVERELTPEDQSRLLTIDHMLSRISFDLAKLKKLEKQLTEERAVLEGCSGG